MFISKFAILLRQLKAPRCPSSRRNCQIIPTEKSGQPQQPTQTGAQQRHRDAVPLDDNNFNAQVFIIQRALSDQQRERLIKRNIQGSSRWKLAHTRCRRHGITTSSPTPELRFKILHFVYQEVLDRTSSTSSSKRTQRRRRLLG